MAVLHLSPSVLRRERDLNPPTCLFPLSFATAFTECWAHRETQSIFSELNRIQAGPQILPWRKTPPQGGQPPCLPCQSEVSFEVQRNLSEWGVRPERHRDVSELCQFPIAPGKSWRWPENGILGVCHSMCEKDHESFYLEKQKPTLWTAPVV